MRLLPIAALPVAALFFATDEALVGSPAWLKIIAELGAYGLLVYVLWCLLSPKRGLLSRALDEQKEQRERMDAWEHERHEDSEKLNQTLRDMTAHCSEQTARR